MAIEAGIAFGGGGARGMAHVGIVRALETQRFISPVIYAGTSIGSVVAVLLAAGKSAAEIEKLAVNLEWLRDVVKLTDVMDPRTTAGLLPNTRLGELVNEQIGNRSFDDLPVDVAVVATDIEHRRRVIMTSRRVAARIDQGELERYLPPELPGLPGAETVVLSNITDVGLAVRASCAVPGFFRTVNVHGMHLVDGGLVDQTPVDVVRAMGASFSVGVSLALSFMPARMEHVFDALSGTVGMLGIHQLRKSLDLADIGFQVTGIDNRSPVKPHQTDLIAIGERDMNEYLHRYFSSEKT